MEDPYLDHDESVDTVSSELPKRMRRLQTVSVDDGEASPKVIDSAPRSQRRSTISVADASTECSQCSGIPFPVAPHPEARGTRSMSDEELMEGSTRDRRALQASIDEFVRRRSAASARAHDAAMEAEREAAVAKQNIQTVRVLQRFIDELTKRMNQLKDEEEAHM